MGLLQDLLLHTLTSNLTRLNGALRPSLRRFFINLDDFEVPPSPPVFIFGLPFKLTGRVQFLSLRLPWRKLSTLPIILHAKGVKLCLTECSITDKEQRKAVFEAFLRDVRELKEYTLNNVQYTQTYPSRILQKFLPFLLDRIQIDLSDVNIKFNFHSDPRTEETLHNKFHMLWSLEKLTTSSNHSSTRRDDLAKKFTVSDFRIVTTSSNLDNAADNSADKLMEVRASSCEIGLNLTNGQYHVDLNVEDDVALHIDEHLKHFVNDVRSRINNWQTAYRYKRPGCSVGDDPKAWFRYAYLLKLARLRNNNTSLSENRVRAFMRSFVEYKELHTSRLRNQRSLTKQMESRIIELEDSFDIDMILMLREQARKDVLALQVVDINSYGWIHRALFGGSNPDEKNELVNEIRQALAVAEASHLGSEGEDRDTDADEVYSTAPKEWSKVQTHIMLHSITITVADTKGFMRTRIQNLGGGGELDSSLESFSVHVSVGNLCMQDGHLLSLRKGSLVNSNTESSVEHSQTVLDLKVQKTALSEFASVDLVVQDAFHVVLTRRTVERLKWLLETIYTLQTTNQSDLNVGNLPSPNSNTSDPGATFQMTISVPSVEIWFGVGDHLHSSSNSERGFLVSVTNANLFLGIESGYISMDIRSKASLTSSWAMVQKEIEASLPLECRMDKIVVHPDYALEISAELSVSQENSNMSVQVLSSRVSVDINELHNVLLSAFSIVQQVVKPFFAENEKSLQVGDNYLDQPTSSLSKGQTVEFTSLVLILVQSESEGDKETAEILSTRLKDLRFLLHNSQVCTASVANVSVIEKRHGGSLHLKGITEHQPCASLRYQLPSLKAEQSQYFDVHVGSVSSVIKPQSVHEFVKIFYTVLSALPEDPHSRPTVNHLQRQQSAPRSLFDVKSIRIELLSDKAHFLAKCTNVFVIQNLNALTGSITGIEITNLRNDAGCQSWVIKCLPLNNPILADDKRLTFTISPTSSNLTIGSLHFILTNTILSQISSSITSIQQAVRSAQVEFDPKQVSDDKLAEPAGPHEAHHRPSSSTITIQGTTLFLQLPWSATKPDAVSVEVPHVTAILSDNSTIVSLRKLSILTRAHCERRDGVFSMLRRSPAIDLPNWVVVLRGLDLDISNRYSIIMDHSNRSDSVRNNWSISVLSHTTISATSGQISLVTTVISNLLIGPKSTEPSSSEHIAVQPNTKSKSAVCSIKTGNPSYTSSNCINVKVDTDNITINAFLEDPNGEINSSIAAIEFSAISLSWQFLQENYDGHCSTIVKTWNVSCDAVQIKDTSLDPSSPRHIFCEVSTSALGLHSMQDGCKEANGIELEIVTRQDAGMKPRTHFRVKAEPLFLRISGTLILSVSEFFNRAFLQSPHIVEEGSTASSSGSDRVEEISISMDESIAEPSRKVSIELVNTTVRLYPGLDSPRMQYIDVCLAKSKIVLISSDQGKQLRGSAVRLFGISMVYDKLFLPDSISAINRSQRGKSSSALPDNELSSLQIPQFNDITTRSTPSMSATELRLPEFEDGDCTECELSNDTAITVFEIRNANIRFPNMNNSKLVTEITDVHSDVPIEGLMLFIQTLLVAEIFSEMNEELFTERSSNADTFGIDFVADRVSLTVQIPTTAALLTEIQSVRNMALLQVDASVSFQMDNNLQNIDGRLNLSVEARDEQKLIRDKLLAPMSLSLKVTLGTHFKLALSCDRYIKITLSPLTTRLLQGLQLSLQVPVSQQSHANQESTRDLVLTYESHRPSINQTQFVSFALSGVIIYCTSEDSRAQLLRLTFRDVNSSINVVSGSTCERMVDAWIGDVILEDVISRYTFRKEDEEVDKWSTILCGIRTQNRFEHMQIEDSYARSVSLSQLISRVYPAVAPIPESNSIESPHERSLNQVESPSCPVVRITLRWKAPSDDISSNVIVSGLKINLDMAIIPSITDWLESIHLEADAVRRAHQAGKPLFIVSKKSNTESPQTRIRVDHIRIDPITLNLAIRAPPRHLQHSWLRRLLSNLFGAESITDTNITLQSVIFNGNFQSVSQVFDRIQALYTTMFLSRGLIVQLLYQASRFAGIAKVLGMTYLRRRSYGPHITQRAHWRVENLRLSESRVIGLGAIFVSDQLPQGTLVQRNWDLTSIRKENSKVECQPYDLETLDLTFGEDLSVLGTDENGKELFRQLRLRDHRIPRDDTFTFYSAFSFSVSILVTNKFLLFLTTMSQAIQEPMIERRNVVEYKLTGARITIVWQQISQEPSIRRIARLTTRDTSTLATTQSQPYFSTRTMIHEIECTSPAVASSLHQRLMNAGRSGLGLGIVSVNFN